MHVVKYSEHEWLHTVETLSFVLRPPGPPEATTMNGFLCIFSERVSTHPRILTHVCFHRNGSIPQTLVCLALLFLGPPPQKENQHMLHFFK